MAARLFYLNNHIPFNYFPASFQIADFALTLRGGQIDVVFGKILIIVLF